MSDNRTLRERLLETVDDLDAIVKQLVVRVVEKDRSNETVSSLSRSFHTKQGELKKLLQKVPAHREREKLIRNLKKAVVNRNAAIMQIENDLQDAEFALTGAVYQAGMKIKLMRQAESRKVNSEQVIRFANQISRWYSVAAPLGWQYGDPSRPFPTEAELRLSALAAPRVTAPTSQPALSLLRQPGTSTSSPGIMRGSGRGSSPMTAPYSSSALHQQRTWSPRGGFAQQSSSPRGRGSRGGGVISPRVNISGAALMQRRQSGAGTSPRASPSSAYGIGGKGVHPPVKNVEQMSSDSSSSSSSDEGSPS